MQELHAALVALQDMDKQVMQAEARVAEFNPQLQTLLAPVVAAERELTSAHAKLEEMRNEQQALEKRATAKWERYQAYQDKLSKARGSRDEAALKSESELVRKAAEADESDKRSLHEQATRADLKLDDLRRMVDKQRAEVAERQAELELARTEAQQQLDVLREQRENVAVRLDAPSRRLYEQLRKGKSRNVVAPMTDEGACGNCFNILPLQEQVEVRRAERLHRCEGCGVILYAT